MDGVNTVEWCLREEIVALKIQVNDLAGRDKSSRLLLEDLKVENAYLVTRLTEAHNKNTESGSEIVAGVNERLTDCLRHEIRALETKNAELKNQISKGESGFHNLNHNHHNVVLSIDEVRRLAGDLISGRHGNEFVVDDFTVIDRPVKPPQSSASVLKELWPEWKFPKSNGEFDHCVIKPTNAKHTWLGIARKLDPLGTASQQYDISPLSPAQAAYGHLEGKARLDAAASAVKEAWAKETAAINKQLEVYMYGPQTITGVGNPFGYSSEGADGAAIPKQQDSTAGTVTATGIDRVAGTVTVAGTDRVAGKLGNRCPRCNDFNEYAEPGNRICYGCSH